MTEEFQSEVETTEQTSASVTQSNKSKSSNLKKYIIGAVFLFICFILIYTRASSRKSSLATPDDTSSIASSVDEDVLPSSPVSLNQYDLYAEIQQFMDRQSSYVMNL